MKLMETKEGLWLIFKTIQQIAMTFSNRWGNFLNLILVEILPALGGRLSH
jgi:hypothetical protein